MKKSSDDWDMWKEYLYKECETTWFLILSWFENMPTTLGSVFRSSALLFNKASQSTSAFKSLTNAVEAEFVSTKMHKKLNKIATFILFLLAQQANKIPRTKVNSIVRNVSFDIWLLPVRQLYGNCWKQLDAWLYTDYKKQKSTASRKQFLKSLL